MKQPSKSFPGRALPLDIQVMKTTPNRQSLTQHKNPIFVKGRPVNRVDRGITE
jgi:hypothetical protein